MAARKRKPSAKKKAPAKRTPPKAKPKPKPEVALEHRGVYLVKRDGYEYKAVYVAVPTPSFVAHFGWRGAEHEQISRVQVVKRIGALPDCVSCVKKDVPLGTYDLNRFLDWICYRGDDVDFSEFQEDQSRYSPEDFLCSDAGDYEVYDEADDYTGPELDEDGAYI